MNSTYHLTRKEDFDSQAQSGEYMPATFARDGFIHCTDDPDEMARVANLFYRSEPPPHLYLVIDKERLRAPWQYDDEEKKYPHIYGPINKDAIVETQEARRQANGNFLPPEKEQ